MADNANAPRVEDLKSVGTRISWGAVLAGAVVALALYVVFTALGAAIGFSLGRDMSYKALANGALVWAILTVGMSLFAGGWTTSQLTAGETKCESMIHGLILWGTVVAAMLWMTASGIRSGFNGMLSVAYAGNSAADGHGGAAALRRVERGREREAGVVRAFDPEDVRPHVREHHPGERDGPDAADLEDLDAVQRATRPGRDLAHGRK